TTDALDRNDTSGFRERAQRVLNTQPNWAAVLLADPAGHRLMDTRFASPAPQPLAEPLSFDTVVRTRAPAVGNLAKGLDGSLLFPVRVPVLRNGELRYVLTAVVKPEEILDVVKRQQVPSDWVISIFDANGLRVARSRAHPENLGGQAAVTLQKLMASGADEGFGMTFSLEGDRIYASYSRLKDSGWSAAPGIPATLVEGAALRSPATSRTPWSRPPPSARSSCARSRKRGERRRRRAGPRTNSWRSSRTSSARHSMPCTGGLACCGPGGSTRTGRSGRWTRFSGMPTPR